MIALFSINSATWLHGHWLSAVMKLERDELLLVYVIARLHFFCQSVMLEKKIR